MDRSRFLFWLRNKAPRLAVELAVNFALPLLIYHRMHGQHGEVSALLASSAPPFLWGVGSFVRERRVDALSILAMVGIALSVLAYFGGGSVQMLQLREKMVTLLIGLAFLGSAAIGKPLIYPLARATMKRESDAALAEFDAKGNDVFVRHTIMVMTLAWGIGLIADVAVSVVLIFTLSIEHYLIVGPILGYSVIGGLSLWTILYRRYRTGRRATRDARRILNQVPPPPNILPRQGEVGREAGRRGRMPDPERRESPPSACGCHFPLAGED